jgi:hypothetical protein
MITKLATECYTQNASREDKALYYTMLAIRDRLESNLVVKHPVTPNETITKGESDPKARFFKEKLSEVLNYLDVLFKADCNRKEALKAWDNVFNTTYFIEKLEEENEKSASVKAGLSNITSSVLTYGSNSYLNNRPQTRHSESPSSTDELYGRKVIPRSSFGED